jgi:hypothetical protein
MLLKVAYKLRQRQRNSSFIFSALADALGKNKCAVLALAFLVQMFNFSTISALCTTVSI